MGCASSKQMKHRQRLCKNCRAPYSSAVQRSHSMHVHHPPRTEGDTYHLVALTSTTLGSLKLDLSDGGHVEDCNPTETDEKANGDDQSVPDKTRSKEFSMGLIEAKTWSNMMREKIPKTVPRTPVRTPPGEPETINAWELMEGLEDSSPLRPPHQLCCFSFHVAPNSIPPAFDLPNSGHQENEDALSKPLWMLEMGRDDDSVTNSNSNATSIISEFEPEVISTFRKALEDLSPSNPFHLRTLDSQKEQGLAGNNQQIDNKCPQLPLGKDKVVPYFTSLRGVRKTYEDCCHVKVILKGLGVRVDERDVSMHSGFKEEVRELMGGGSGCGGLPRVFVGKKQIGGAEEIRKMHEDGQLEKLLEGCEMADDGCGGGGGVGRICEACGDIRFVPCETCSGSCKIYCEGEYEDEEGDESEYGFQRCPDCNENGIIRCPICCD